MPRLFTAIDLPESIRRKLAWLDLPPADLARLTPPDDLHITLHFIGEVPDALCEAVQLQLRTVTAASFVQELSGVGSFANRGRPEILWAGVEQPAELLSLREQVGDVLKSLEISLDEREFNPHITVARLKRPSPAAADTFAERNASFHSRFTATTFSLYSVAPHGQEPHYRVLEEYRLQTPWLDSAKFSESSGNTSTQRKPVSW